MITTRTSKVISNEHKMLLSCRSVLLMRLKNIMPYVGDNGVLEPDELWEFSGLLASGIKSRQNTLRIRIEGLTERLWLGGSVLVLLVRVQLSDFTIQAAQ